MFENPYQRWNEEHNKHRYDKKWNRQGSLKLIMSQFQRLTTHLKPRYSKNRIFYWWQSVRNSAWYICTNQHGNISDHFTSSQERSEPCWNELVCITVNRPWTLFPIHDHPSFFQWKQFCLPLVHLAPTTDQVNLEICHGLPVTWKSQAWFNIR